MEQKYKSRKGMAEHRFVIEEHFGRKLKTNEHVHHINGDKTDNRLKNLVVMTPKAHMFIHKQKYPIFKKNVVFATDLLNLLQLKENEIKYVLSSAK